MAFVILGALGSRIDDRYVGIGLHQLFNHTGLDSIVGAWGAFPYRESIFKHLDILVAKFFRLPGGVMTQLSSGTLAIKNKQGFLVLRQTAYHGIELTIRDADGGRNVALVIFRTLGP